MIKPFQNNTCVKRNDDIFEFDHPYRRLWANASFSRKLPLASKRLTPHFPSTTHCAFRKWQNRPGRMARRQEGKMAKWQKGREARSHEGKIEIESIFRWKMCEVRWRGNKWFAYHGVPQNSEQLRIQKLSLSSLSAVFYQFLQFRLFISVSFAMTATQWLIIQS